jgi:hypothetical protein
MLDETPASKHWYDSRRGKVAAFLLVLLLAGGSIYLLLAARKTSHAEAHYAALEQHRAAQSQSVIALSRRKPPRPQCRCRPPS